jgi:hypothetical protein
MEVSHMANVTYYLIRERRLGKKTDDGYFLYDGRGWIPDERNVIRDHLMGYDPNDKTPYGFGRKSVRCLVKDVMIIGINRYTAIISSYPKLALSVFIQGINIGDAAFGYICKFIAVITHETCITADPYHAVIRLGHRICFG